MFPWFWLWAPQVHFPWSGDVAQRIAPATHWFFQGISPDAGDADIEERAFSVASYGKQLGLITEVLIDIAEQAGPGSEKARRSLERLKAIQDEIEQVKTSQRENRAARIATEIADLQRKGGAGYDELVRRLAPLLPPER